MSFFLHLSQEYRVGKRHGGPTEDPSGACLVFVSFFLFTPFADVPAVGEGPRDPSGSCLVFVSFLNFDALPSQKYEEERLDKRKTPDEKTKRAAERRKRRKWETETDDGRARVAARAAMKRWRDAFRPRIMLIIAAAQAFDVLASPLPGLVPEGANYGRSFADRKNNHKDPGLDGPPPVFHATAVAPKYLRLADVHESDFKTIKGLSGLDVSGDDPWLFHDDGRPIKKVRALLPNDPYLTIRKGAAQWFVWSNAFFVEALEFVEIMRGRMVHKARHGEGELYVYCFTHEHPTWGSFFQHRIGGGVVPRGPGQVFAKTRLPLLVEPNITGLVVVQVTWPNGPDGEPALSVVDEEDFDE